MKKCMLAYLLTAAMAFSSVPVMAATPGDLGGHWAEKAMTQWQEKGLISGYEDGSMKPDKAVSRAEFVIMMNNAMGFVEAGEIAFKDVKAGDWYYGAVAKAVKAGYCGGYTDGTFKPGATITRAEAAVMIANAGKLTANEAAAEEFTDAASLPTWAKGGIGAAAAAGFMSGYPDGSFGAGKTITRAEAVSSLNRLMAGAEEQEQQPETKAEDVVVTKAGAVIENQNITGNLIIDQAVGDGEVYINDTVVKGNILVKGGGDHSVYLKNVQVGGKIAVMKQDVRVQLSGETKAETIEIEKISVLTAKDFEGEIGTIAVLGELGTNQAVSIAVPAEKVVIEGKASVRLEADVNTVEVSEEAAGAKLDIAKDVTVKTVVADAKVAISGSGKVEKLEANADGITVNKNLDIEKTEVADGVKKPTAGTSGGGGGSGSGGSTQPAAQNLTISENHQTVSEGTYQNVTITDAVGEGEVTLENLTINGDLTINGGGSNSIVLKNCVIKGKVIMDKDGENAPRLLLTNTPVIAVEAVKPAIIEAADSASAVATVEAKAELVIQGGKTIVKEIKVPATVEAAVAITVSAATVEKVEAQGETKIQGEDNAVVDTVVAEAPVTVDSAAVAKVEVPATATAQVEVKVEGTEKIEVAVNAEAGAAIKADKGSNIEVSSERETAPPVTKQEGENGEPVKINHIHRWNEGNETTPATCEKDGEMTYTCIAEGCGDTKATKTEAIPALGHSWGQWTADQDADTHTRLCQKNPKHSETEKHSWDKGVVTKEPTSTETGIRTYTCSGCAATKTEPISATATSSDFVVNDTPMTVSGETFNEVTVRYSSQGGSITFKNCTFNSDVKVYCGEFEPVVDFDSCDFVNDAKVQLLVDEGVATGTMSHALIKLDQCKNAGVKSEDVPVMVRNGNHSGKYTLNGLTVDVTCTDEGKDMGHSVVYMAIGTEGKKEYTIHADRIFSMSIEGTEDATFTVGGQVDLSKLNMDVANRQPIILNNNFTGTGFSKITLGTNTAQITANTNGIYYIYVEDGNSNPVKGDIPDDAAVFVNDKLNHQPANDSYIYNIRFEQGTGKEAGFVYLTWDFIPSEKVENTGDVHFEVWASGLNESYDFETSVQKMRLTLPAGNYYFDVLAYYGDGLSSIARATAEVEMTVTEGSTSEQGNLVVFKNTGDMGYLVTMSGLSNYQAFKLEWLNFDNKIINTTIGSVELCLDENETTVTTGFDYYDVGYAETYKLYGIKDYRLEDGNLSYTIDLLGTGAVKLPQSESMMQE